MSIAELIPETDVPEVFAILDVDPALANVFDIARCDELFRDRLISALPKPSYVTAVTYKQQRHKLEPDAAASCNSRAPYPDASDSWISFHPPTFEPWWLTFGDLVAIYDHELFHAWERRFHPEIRFPPSMREFLKNYEAQGQEDVEKAKIALLNDTLCEIRTRSYMTPLQEIIPGVSREYKRSTKGLLDHDLFLVEQLLRIPSEYQECSITPDYTLELKRK